MKVKEAKMNARMKKKKKWHDSKRKRKEKV